MEGWIAPHCTGGLGNRLFQLAAAAGCAERWKRKLVFFLPKCRYTDHGKYENIFLLYHKIPIIEIASDWEMIIEPPGTAFRYLDMGEKAPTQKNIILDGYRQSPEYFPRNDSLEPDFQFALGKETWSSLQTTWNLGTPEQRRKTWFLHVRLGDYKILPHHQVDLSRYYTQMLAKIPDSHRLLFFSDEPELCQETFSRLCKERGIFFQNVNEKDEMRSLFLMSICWGGAICANSTFSWWGAYFAHQSAEMEGFDIPVYFPGKWGNGLPPPTDLFPKWAHKIDV
jgi:hypothetical protein